MRRSYQHVRELEHSLSGMDNDVELLEEQQQLIKDTTEDLKERKEIHASSYRASMKLYKEAREDYEAVSIVHSGLEPVSDVEAGDTTEVSVFTSVQEELLAGTSGH